MVAVGLLEKERLFGEWFQIVYFCRDYCDCFVDEKVLLSLQ
jgi:hypothetical protein